jgi:hypothetical protein
MESSTLRSIDPQHPDRPDGDRGENLREAIACYQRALEVRTRESYPQDWARTMENLDRVSMLFDNSN